MCTGAPNSLLYARDDGIALPLLDPARPDAGLGVGWPTAALVAVRRALPALRVRVWDKDRDERTFDRAASGVPAFTASASSSVSFAFCSSFVASVLASGLCRDMSCSFFFSCRGQANTHTHTRTQQCHKLVNQCTVSRQIFGGGERVL